jgi:hypothetical protein
MSDVGFQTSDFSRQIQPTRCETAARLAAIPSRRLLYGFVYLLRCAVSPYTGGPTSAP